MDNVGNSWQAAAARQNFSELVDAAVEGRPQFVRRRDGQEVVVVSREYFERTKPDLKTVLLSFQFGHDDDGFDRALEEGREVVSVLFVPDVSEGSLNAFDDTGHEHPERTSETETAPGSGRVAGGHAGH